MDILKADDKFRYMMLSRLKSDCDYYLGNGNRSSNSLWAKDENEQIKTMKDLHNSFDENEKPEWLTWDQILEYERQMTEKFRTYWKCQYTGETFFIVSEYNGEEEKDQYRAVSITGGYLSEAVADDWQTFKNELEGMEEVSLIEVDQKDL